MDFFRFIFCGIKIAPFTDVKDALVCVLLCGCCVLSFRVLRQKPSFRFRQHAHDYKSTNIHIRIHLMQIRWT